MKTRILTILLSVFSVFTFAQITVTDTDVFSVGDIAYQAHDANSGTAINVGSTGLNQSWDFSSLQESSLNTIFFISPIGTNYENQYPDANLCMDDNGSLSYYKKTSTGVFLHGVGDTVFSSPALFYPLPLTYGLNISDGPIVVIDTAITGPFLSIAIPPATVVALSSGLANRADTALVQITNTTEFLVDASGTLTTPLGTFDVLRLKRVQTTNSILDVYCSDTISGLGSWVTNIPFSSIPFLAGLSNNEIEYKYQWITNDISVEFILAEIVVDDSDNIINGVSFQTTALSSSITENKRDIFNIFPIPTTYNVTITSERNEEVGATLSDINGRELMNFVFVNSTELDLSNLDKGIYILNLNTKEGSISKKLIIE